MLLESGVGRLARVIFVFFFICIFVSCRLASGKAPEWDEDEDEETDKEVWFISYTLS